MKNVVWLTCALVLAACGDDSNPTNPDAGPDPDAPPDAPPSYVPPEPFAVNLSAAGPDQLMSAVAGPGGTFYAAGFAAPTLADPREVIVVKLTSAGALDTSFGDGDGIASTGVAYVGGSDEIDIAKLADGSLVVSATVAAATVNPVDASDRDIAVMRLDADGELDATFGGGDGVAVFSLNTSILDGVDPVGRDGARGLAVDGDGKIYVHAYQRGEGLAGGGGPRLDTDYAAVRILADGSALDATFGTAGSGKHLLDIAESGATPRGIHVLADGSVLAGGYARSSIVGTEGPQTVLYKLTSAGVLDTAFAEDGLFHEVVLGVQTEVYNFAVHGANIVTAGYGRNSGTINEWVSLRFNTTTGARDATWGGAPMGAVMVDPSPSMMGSNCRNAVALPGGKTLLIGSTGPGNMPAQDAALAVLDDAGRLDEAFGDGVHTFELGANGNDQFWGAVANGDNALIVGYKGGGPAGDQTDTVNDDAFGVILPL